MNSFRAFLFLFIAILTNGKRVDSTECTRKCTVDDANSECWRQSLSYYSEQLLTALEEYVGTLTHMSRWNHRQPGTGPKYPAMARTVLAGVVSKAENGQDLTPLNAEGVAAVLEIILNKTALIEDHYNDPEVIPPSFLCPTPCEYHENIWRTLFFVNLAVLLLLCISFFMYLAVQQLRQDKAKAR